MTGRAARTELFRTTRWSLVLGARGADPGARRALDALCAAYRPAVVAYIRLRGHPAQDADDLAQGFFTSLIEKDFASAAEPARGRFRAFLLTLLQHHLVDAGVASSRLKRGGGAAHVSLDGEDAPDPAAQTGDPERAFELAWAVTVVDRAMARLREEAAASGKLALFERLSAFLVEAPDDADYARAAEALGLRRNTLAVAVHRLRHRLRALICAELADTVVDPDDVEAELADLRAALGAAL